MSVNASLTFGGPIIETATYGISSGGVSVPWGELIRTTIQLGANSSPAADTAWSGLLTLAAGTLTFALDAMPRTDMDALDFEGKRILAFVVQNLGLTAMTFGGAVAQPFNGLFGAAADPTTVPPGGFLQGYAPVGYGTVAAASASDITVDGDGVETFRLILVAGPV